MESRVPAESASPGGAATSGPRPADREGLLQQSREFLDFFWDIAKPEQETRLEATEKLLAYLRARPQVRRRAGGARRLEGQGQGRGARRGWRCAPRDRSPHRRPRSLRQGPERKYALKRLITGLGVGRETARPCYSLALAQVSGGSGRGPAGRLGRWGVGRAGIRAEARPREDVGNRAGPVPRDARAGRPGGEQFSFWGRGWTSLRGSPTRQSELWGGLPCLGEVRRALPSRGT